MPPTTVYSFGDLVLVPFPFTDQSGLKKRPAVIVSSATYHGSRRDLILMAVTSQVRFPLRVGELEIVDWKVAGLLLPSLVKPVVTTIDGRLVERRLGQLTTSDQAKLRKSLMVTLD